MNLLVTTLISPTIIAERRVCSYRNDAFFELKRPWSAH
jgi:hypothetical protein